MAPRSARSQLLLGTCLCFFIVAALLASRTSRQAGARTFAPALRGAGPARHPRRRLICVIARGARGGAEEAELRQEMAGMRARNIKQELEALGISTAGAFDKEELVERLLAARLQGLGGSQEGAGREAAPDATEAPSHLIYRAKLVDDDRTARALNAEILEAARQLCLTDAEGQTWCAGRGDYAGGYTSYGTERGRALHRSTQYGSALEKQLAPHAACFLKQLKDEDLQRPDLKYSLKDCWVNFMGEGAEHAMHDHVDSIISGTYYVQTPVDSPGICFVDPQLGPEEVEYPVEAGEVILFPGWMNHRVPPNFGEDDRVSVSFNYKIDRGDY